MFENHSKIKDNTCEGFWLIGWLVLLEGGRFFVCLLGLESWRLHINFSTNDLATDFFLSLLFVCFNASKSETP